ncbi:MAG TPA: NAD(P)/FAD-dependent oxidoreductase [Sandaracinaceae bacterium LLY-WYZ-13_1]|nr:NAD(P)/FAD-dependent oxidoreductase [Sandaracinaceae bacterium LLY-WYZ-13_1]
MRIVIIGNGVAGIEAALVVRQREPSWEITIVSEESDHFFSRTALMWVVSGQLSQRCIEPHERDLYARMELTRVRARAVGLDTEGRRVLLAGDLDPVPYDRLLIACGSRPRPGPWPGADLPGVGHFVTMQDLEWLETELHGGPSHGGRPPRPDAHLAHTTEGSPYRPRPSLFGARGRPRAPAVIGGGLIGIEAAEVMVAAGLRPRFFIREEWFWPIAIDEAESTWVADRMREHGVDVRLEENVEALEGDDHVERVITDRGEYECDHCVVAIGVIPNTDWLGASDGEGRPRGEAPALDDGGGIVVDAGLATSADDVFAAGDCASVPWFDGSRRPEQLWYTARAQGRVAGRRLLGDRVAYDRGVWFNSAKLMDVEYTTAGWVNLNLEDERNWFFEERGAVRSTTRIVLSGERVVGFNLLGRRWDHAVLMRWIEEHRSLGWVLDHLAEASFDTELVPPLVIPEEARRRPPAGPAPSKIDPPKAAPRFMG